MKFLKKIVNRLTVVSLALALQLLWLIAIPFILTQYYYLLSSIFTLFSLIVVALIINRQSDPAIKLAWVVPILVFPILGWAIYLLFGTDFSQKLIDKKLRSLPPVLSRRRFSSREIIDGVKSTEPSLAGLMNYTAKNGFPVFRNTSTKYYPLGDLWFSDLLDELKKAEKFIFLEFFIIKQGYMWDSILEILKERAACGVDVRVIYDDVGSINHIPSRYYKDLQKLGIKCFAFNKFRPFLSIIMNNRDHRKIAVIDGKVAFTGGANIADEYINKVSPHGHWKDASVRLKGEAAASLTSLFLETWNANRPTDKPGDGERLFLPDDEYLSSCHSDGFVQPYGDSPLDSELLSENIYLSIINGATDYLYIFTPYLITDNLLTDALSLAAKRGVDVRIVIPGVPDKRIVYQVTLSHCIPLINSGVKIYTYTAGFIHSKCFVCDGKVASVGTVNLDYRSLHIHFECGCLFYGSSAVESVYKDAIDTFERSELLVIKKARMGLIKKFFYAALRLFAPLM